MIAPVLGCREAARFLDSYVDGELDPSAVLSIDAHVSGCSPCSERIALLRSIKRAVRADASAESAPASLRARLARSAAALHEEEELPVAKSTRVNTAPVTDRAPPSWRSALPWAAAAAAAIAVGGGVRNYRSPDGTAALASNSAARAQILEEFAVTHARPLPPEELDPARVTKVFSPIVGVPVRPIRLSDVAMANDLYRFNFAGARLMNLRDNEPAATLFYERAAGNGRITVFVYDPNRISVRSSCCLEPRIVRAKGEDRTILVGHAKGYSLAVAEHDGVGYALSSDIAEDEVVELAAGL
jgi:anti-sigma factor (TIGR02949 family)